ncbi:E3 ubiquitin-protein ligase rnft1 [Gurleya vavrai]
MQIQDIAIPVYAKDQYFLVNFTENCTICLSFHTSPQILNCSHIFCKECVSDCIRLYKCCILCKSLITSVYDVRFTFKKEIQVYDYIIMKKGDSKESKICDIKEIKKNSLYVAYIDNGDFFCKICKENYIMSSENNIINYSCRNCNIKEEKHKIKTDVICDKKQKKLTKFQDKIIIEGVNQDFFNNYDNIDRYNIKCIDRKIEAENIKMLYEKKFIHPKLSDESINGKNSKSIVEKKNFNNIETASMELSTKKLSNYSLKPDEKAINNIKEFKQISSQIKIEIIDSEKKI